MPAEDNGNTIRASVAELIGTFILVFAGTAVATGAVLQLPIAGAPLNSLAVGLTFGLTLAAIVAAFGRLSGAHVNPAVTIGLAVAGKFPWKNVPIYIVAQFLGAILAALAVWGTFGDAARGVPALAATFPAAGVTNAQAFLMEALVTFFLVFVVVTMVSDESSNTTLTSLAIGFALGVGVLIAGPVTGGAVNPARALGPMIVAGKFTSFWVYLLAPVVGGIVAAVIHNWALTARRVVAIPVR